MLKTGFVAGDFASCRLYPGFALVVLGNHIEYDYDIDTEDYVPYELAHVYDCYMVGDDELLHIDESDLTLLTNDFCRGCGQLGCSWH